MRRRHTSHRLSRRPRSRPFGASDGRRACKLNRTYAMRYIIPTLQHQALAHWPVTRRRVHITDCRLDRPPEASRRSCVRTLMAH
eukprot:6204053-Prymnesium_polylepis.1